MCRSLTVCRRQNHHKRDCGGMVQGGNRAMLRVKVQRKMKCLIQLVRKSKRTQSCALLKND